MTNESQNERNPEEMIPDARKTRNAESVIRPRAWTQLLCDLETDTTNKPMKI